MIGRELDGRIARPPLELVPIGGEYREHICPCQADFVA